MTEQRSPTTCSSGCQSTARPDVVLASGLAVDGYVPVDPATLATRYPGVYAVGDCATTGVPKAGAFAEGAAAAVAAQLIAAVRGDPPPEPYRGIGAAMSSSAAAVSAG